MDKTIAIIPARGGSKGIPQKNLINICGKPLLAWSVLQCVHSELISDVYVSSDSDEILGISESFGARPIKRPDELSTDTASSEAALLHTLETIGQKQSLPKEIVFLQATSPLRFSKDIDNAVEHFRQTQCDSMFSMSVIEDLTVWKNTNSQLTPLTFDPNARGTRQERPDYFLENGSIYVSDTEQLMRTGNRLCGNTEVFRMPLWQSQEIDTLEDVDLCEYYFQKHLMNEPYARS